MGAAPLRLPSPAIDPAHKATRVLFGPRPSGRTARRRLSPLIASKLVYFAHRRAPRPMTGQAKSWVTFSMPSRPRRHEPGIERFNERTLIFQTRGKARGAHNDPCAAPSSIGRHPQRQPEKSCLMHKCAPLNRIKSKVARNKRITNRARLSIAPNIFVFTSINF